MGTEEIAVSLTFHCLMHSDIVERLLSDFNKLLLPMCHNMVYAVINYTTSALYQHPSVFPQECFLLLYDLTKAVIYFAQFSHFIWQRLASLVPKRFLKGKLLNRSDSL